MAREFYDVTKTTWGEIANKQAADEMATGHFDEGTPIEIFDPVYGKLIETIGRTLYRKISVMQRWKGLGTQEPSNDYPQQLREIMMLQRKGKNFPMDAGTRPTTLLNYDIVDDDIEVRYHSAQFRWMYDYTLFDHELRRFSNGGPSTITQLHEMKSIGAMSARNMFVDAVKKTLMAKYIQIMLSNPTQVIDTGIDITDYSTLTQEQAKEWLVMVDNLLHELQWGTAKYNYMGQYMQTPVSDLQIIIPRSWYMNVLRRAFPETYHTTLFENILPENLFLCDDLGTSQIVQPDGTPITPTYDAKGMSLLNWTGSSLVQPTAPEAQMFIMHKGVLGFEDNLDTVRVGTTDAAKLATPVFMHHWMKAYFTDLLPAVLITGNNPLTATP